MWRRRAYVNAPALGVALGSIAKPSVNPQGQNGKPAAGVNGKGTLPRVWHEEFFVRSEEFFHENTQLQAGQRRARADVDALPVKEVFSWIPAKAKRACIFENFFVPVGGDPIQRNSFSF